MVVHAQGLCCALSLVVTAPHTCHHDHHQHWSECHVHVTWWKEHTERETYRWGWRCPNKSRPEGAPKGLRTPHWCWSARTWLLPSSPILTCSVSPPHSSCETSIPTRNQGTQITTEFIIPTSKCMLLASSYNVYIIYTYVFLSKFSRMQTKHIYEWFIIKKYMYIYIYIWMAEKKEKKQKLQS